MKSRSLLFTFCIALSVPILLFAQDSKPKKVIYETDMCLDVDDVGALACLHAMADSSEAEILAVCFNEVHKSGAPAIDAINTWYNRGDIPVGIYKGNLSNPDGSKYLDNVAGFPHDLEKADAKSALDVYLQVLGSQPDSSVTIVSVGFLNNIYDLLKANKDMVAKKVVELVVMGGLIDDGFNLVRHNLVDESEYVIRNWPTPLVISQHGHQTYTGASLKDTPSENPVREAYYRWFDKSFKGRSSWDQVAVLYGVWGVSTIFNEITSGKGRLPNGYEWQMKPGARSYLETKISDSKLENIIEALMIKPPQEATSAEYFSSNAKNSRKSENAYLVPLNFRAAGFLSLARSGKVSTLYNLQGKRVVNSANLAKRKTD